MSEQGSCNAEIKKTQRLNDFCFRVINLAVQAIEIADAHKLFMASTGPIFDEGPSFNSFRTKMSGLIELFENTSHLSNRPAAEPVAQLFPVKNIDLPKISDPIAKLRLLCLRFEPTAIYKQQFAHHDPAVQSANDHAERVNKLACILFAKEYLEAYKELVDVMYMFGLDLGHKLEPVDVCLGA